MNKMATSIFQLSFLTTESHTIVLNIFGKRLYIEIMIDLLLRSLNTVIRSVCI